MRLTNEYLGEPGSIFKGGRGERVFQRCRLAFSIKRNENP